MQTAYCSLLSLAAEVTHTDGLAPLVVLNCDGERLDIYFKNINRPIYVFYSRLNILRIWASVHILVFLLIVHMEEAKTKKLILCEDLGFPEEPSLSNCHQILSYLPHWSSSPSTGGSLPLENCLCWMWRQENHLSFLNHFLALDLLMMLVMPKKMSSNMHTGYKHKLHTLRQRRVSLVGLPLL